MSGHRASDVLIAGYPHAGKSTYLAALWHLMFQDQNGSIQIKKLDGNQEYLQAMENQWLSCAEIDRTKIAESEEIFSSGLRSLKVECGGQIHELVFPDISGEIFSNMWEQREVPKIVVEHIAKCIGALVFVSPLDLREPARIESELRIAGDGVIATGAGAVAVNADSGQNALEWHPKKAATQSKVVELLQMLNHFRGNHQESLRLSLVISAWDAIGEVPETPDKWIESRMPLLFQYIDANQQWLHVKVFGVSAQGGDYHDASRKHLLQSVIHQRDRIHVAVGKESRSTDICLPMIWAMGA